MHTVWIKSFGYETLLGYDFHNLCMMDRKLISCVGFCLRIAQRQGKQSTVEHLWHALYSLTGDDDEQPLKQPLCLYAALGLDTCLASAASSTQVNAAPSAMVDSDVNPGIEFQDFGSCTDKDHAAKLRGQQRSDQASQTEARMIPMDEFDAFVQRFTKDLEKRLI